MDVPGRFSAIFCFFTGLGCPSLGRSSISRTSALVIFDRFTWRLICDSCCVGSRNQEKFSLKTISQEPEMNTPSMCCESTGVDSPGGTVENAAEVVIPAKIPERQLRERSFVFFK